MFWSSSRFHQDMLFYTERVTLVRLINSSLQALGKKNMPLFPGLVSLYKFALCGAAFILKRYQSHFPVRCDSLKLVAVLKRLAG